VLLRLLWAGEVVRHILHRMRIGGLRTCV
jgi:hypothetical protein